MNPMYPSPSFNNYQLIPIVLVICCCIKITSKLSSLTQSSEKGSFYGVKMAATVLGSTSAPYAIQEEMQVIHTKAGTSRLGAVGR